ncbi:hypothetical protein TcWFU_000335 [Taenia crassiceps]|uniref:Uncharacterized protein n=1 Tax=Taenia crassiceps TaxID=6207 RepID=A0ABR4Q2A3_9CEST
MQRKRTAATPTHTDGRHAKVGDSSATQTCNSAGRHDGRRRRPSLRRPQQLSDTPSSADARQMRVRLQGGTQVTSTHLDKTKLNSASSAKYFRNRNPF